MAEMINSMIPRDFEIVCPRNMKFNNLPGDAVVWRGGQCEVLQFLGSWQPSLSCGSRISAFGLINSRRFDV